MAARKERKLTMWHAGLFGVVIVAAAVLGVVNSFKQDIPVVVEQEVEQEEPVAEIVEPVVVDERERNLVVPFTSQAMNSAEEASMAMVIAYYDGTLPAATIDGLPPGYKAEAIDSPTVTELKQFIDDGYPVIVPVAGQVLGNPFYTSEGTAQHTLVLRGYTPTDFLTNDPGTQNGENYAYLYDVLMAAMGDEVVVVRPAASVLP